MNRERGAERVFELLLRCYPPAYRRRYAAGMLDAYRAERAAASGWPSRARFWFWTVLEALRFGAAERRRAGAQGGVSVRSLFTVDVRDALRSLRATPVVTVVAIASLALGIGANTALFSIVNSLVMKRLPVHDPERLAVIDDGNWTNPIWEQVRSHRRELFEDAFAWCATEFNLSTHGETEYADGAWASGGMFDVLGVHATLGRTFTEADDVRGPGAAVAVVSDRFWRTRFGGTPDILGQHLTVDGIPVTVIGVMPRDFFGPDVGRVADIVVPIGALATNPKNARQLDSRSSWWLEIMVRLRPGQSIEQATSALRGIQPAIRTATLPTDWPPKEQQHYLTEPLTLVPAATGESQLRDSYLTPLKIVLGVVALVLLIASANLANVLLARAESRRHELAVRLALGASRFRLARQLLAESALIAAAGAVLGLFLANWGSTLLVQQLQTSRSGAELDLSLDWRVLAFTIGVAALTAIIFGAAPAFGVSRIAPQHALREQTRSITGDRRFGIRSVLVATQVALSLALVVGAALFLRTLTALTATPLGFDPRPVLTVRVEQSGKDVERAGRLAAFERARQAVAAVPGVMDAVVSALVPLGNIRWNTVVEPTPATQGLSPRERAPWVNVVSPGFFHAYGMRVLAGRDFDDHDTEGAERVIVVNEAFVKRFLPGQNPLGQTIKSSLEGLETAPFRIVGVVNDAVYTTQRAGFTPTIYAPLTQLRDVFPDATISARVAVARPEALARDVSRALAASDPALAFTIVPLASVARDAIRQERLVALLGGFFGALAVILAAIGLYGVAAHSVNQRRTEIGIRMALGADASGVVRLVLRRLGGVIVAGVVIGLAGSWWAVQLVSKLLYGLQPRDPLTFAAAAGILVAVGLFAGWMPARRASRIDPVRVLREA